MGLPSPNTAAQQNGRWAKSPVRKTHRRRTRYVLTTVAIAAVLVYTFWTPVAEHVRDCYATAWRARTPPPAARYASRHSLHDKSGLLHVGAVPGEVHPIMDLIRMGEVAWQDKLAAQSRTLREAYDEYIRRYKRRPPRGFDQFNWARKHGVRLLDEYDQIHDDLALFWAIRPSELLSAQQELERHDKTTTIGKHHARSPVEILSLNVQDEQSQHVAEVRARQQIDVLKPIEKFLPPFRATWNTQDEAQFFTSWEMREAARQALSLGEYVDPSTIPPRPATWSSTCAPSFSSYSPNFTSTSKSFIANVVASTDPCHTPALFNISTLLNTPLPGTMQAYPLFTLSKSAPYSDIRGVPVEDWIREYPDKLAWRDKPDERLMWRGTTTGMDFRDGEVEGWNGSHRLRFVDLANRRSGTESVLPPTSDTRPPREWSVAELNDWFMDVGFTATVQCSRALCVQMQREYTMKAPIYESGVEYKYVMDVDGNGWSSRFRRLMSRNSLVLKATIYPEWWTARSQPWVHYVPIKQDYSDLYDVLAFFRGLPPSPTGEEYPGYDELAEKIATAGRRWTEEYWRDEDVTAYAWRLYLEYARVMSLDRASMDFVMDS
ncbi:hypothetical protein BKA62DRAFT_663177 [Auriculariales sp. MPI-PUGE-AT-0066]|nr:hypothetical protein BKA62DRAFT_663177 [Auriculariales sp. MPI-PUGE-AT-0066]